MRIFDPTRKQIANDNSRVKGDRTGNFYSNEEFRKMISGTDHARIKHLMDLITTLYLRGELAPMFPWIRELSDILENGARRWREGRELYGPPKIGKKKRPPSKHVKGKKWHPSKHSLNCCAQHNKCKWNCTDCGVLLGTLPQLKECRCFTTTLIGETP
jgi:hypothetical protein